MKAYSHDNYNQTMGGNNAANRAIEEDNVKSIISDLQNSSLTQKEIADKYNVLPTYVSSINTGLRYARPDIVYPIRRRMDVKTAAEVILKNNLMTFEEISKKFNYSLTFLKKINAGNGNYRIEGLSYPLRPTYEKVPKDLIINDLLTTDLSYDELATKYNVCKKSITRINNGLTYHDDALSYPLNKKLTRKKQCLKRRFIYEKETEKEYGRTVLLIYYSDHKLAIL